MKVTVEDTAIDAVKIVRPQVFRDDRGFFTEVYRQDVFDELGLPSEFVQLNHSRSSRGVLRGLHFQWDPPMGKLMRVTVGEAFLVAVDLRPNSPTLGRWVGRTFSSDEIEQFWAPASFARGFAVLSDVVEIEYLTTGVYNKAGESGIRWDDPQVAVEWPIDEPVLSERDRQAPLLAEWLARTEARSFSVS